MSEGRGDTTYKPTKKHRERAEQHKPHKRPIRTTRRETDYSETQVISDTEEEIRNRQSRYHIY